MINKQEVTKMTNILEQKIEELKADRYDTSIEDARIKAMEADLNRAVGARNEKLQINADIDRKVQILIDAKLMLTQEELDELIEPIQPENDMSVGE